MISSLYTAQSDYYFNNENTENVANNVTLRSIDTTTDSV